MLERRNSYTRSGKRLSWPWPKWSCRSLVPEAKIEPSGLVPCAAARLLVAAAAPFKAARNAVVEGIPTLLWELIARPLADSPPRICVLDDCRPLDRHAL